MAKCCSHGLVTLVSSPNSTCESGCSAEMFRPGPRATRHLPGAACSFLFLGRLIEASSARRFPRPAPPSDSRLGSSSTLAIDPPKHNPPEFPCGRNSLSLMSWETCRSLGSFNQILIFSQKLSSDSFQSKHRGSFAYIKRRNTFE